MMGYFLLFVLVNALLTFIVSQKCGLLTPYDHICTKLNSTVFLISAKPCSSKKNAFTLTIMRTGTNPFFSMTSIDHTMKAVDAIAIGNTSYAAVLDFHEHDEEDNLHVTVRIIKLLIGGSHENIDQIEVYFKMKPGLCQMYKHGDESESSEFTFKNQTVNCAESRQTGDYSTLCFQKDVLFLTVFNPCNVPYSTTLGVLMPHRSLEIFHTFYGTVSNSTVPVKAPGSLGGEQRLKINIYPAEDLKHKHLHDMQRVEVLEYFENLATTKMLISDVYYPVYGMMCPNSLCASISEDTKECNITIQPLDGETILRSSISLKLDVCSSDRLNSNFYMHIYDPLGNKSVSFGDNIASIDPFSSSLLDLHDIFSKFDSGKLSLWITEDKNRNIFHVVLFMHIYPAINTFPLLHTDFHLSRSSACESKPGSRFAVVTIAVPVVCVVVVCFLFVLIVRWRKKRRSRFSRAGLPYEIELGLDDDDHSY